MLEHGGVHAVQPPAALVRKCLDGQPLGPAVSSVSSAHVAGWLVGAGRERTRMLAAWRDKMQSEGTASPKRPASSLIGAAFWQLSPLAWRLFSF